MGVDATRRSAVESRGGGNVTSRRSSSATVFFATAVMALTFGLLPVAARAQDLDTESARFSADGRSVSFAFQGGSATLTRTGERTASLDVREGGRITRLDLERD